MVDGWDNSGGRETFAPKFIRPRHSSCASVHRQKSKNLAFWQARGPQPGVACSLLGELKEEPRGVTPPTALDLWLLVETSTTNRSEEHTSELQSLMRISYAVFCLKKKKLEQHQITTHKRPLHNENR